MIEKIEPYIGKKEGDLGWEDRATWVLERRNRWGWFWRRRYYWRPVIIPGCKQMTLIKTKK